MKISVFKALTLLAKDCFPEAKNYNEEKFSKIKHLFLTGVTSEEDLNLLRTLLKDDLLKEYTVELIEPSDLSLLMKNLDELDGSEQQAYKEAKLKIELINNDPARRYFESILCHETLKDSLDDLNPDILKSFFSIVYQEMPLKMRIAVPKLIYNGNPNGLAALKSATAPEYITAIQKLKDKNNFISLKPSKEVGGKSPGKALEDRVNKMMMLAKIAHAAMTTIHSQDKKFPLDIYKAPQSVYSTPKRGRTDKVDEAGNKQLVKSNNLGIMRSYMPLAQDDALFEHPDMETASQYRRPADSSTYIISAQLPQEIFKTQVTPFSNSISGTMLCQLRVMAKLLTEKRLKYAEDPTQLKLFFKCFISYMVFNSGGHSLLEFVSAIALPEVQDFFAAVPGFKDLNLRQLFQSENQDAFMRAMNKTIEYNDQIIFKDKLHSELNDRVNTNPLDLKKVQKQHASITERIDFALNCLMSGDTQDKEKHARFIIRQINAAKRRQHADPASFIPENQSSVEKVLSVFVESSGLKRDGHEDSEIEKSVQDYINFVRAEKKAQLYHASENTTSLGSRLDKAYEIYLNPQAPFIDREVAQEFLIYILDIKQVDDTLNNQISAAMQLRESVKEKNPDFIPGRSPFPTELIDPEIRALISRTHAFKETTNPTISSLFDGKDLLDVVSKAKVKDRGGKKGKAQKTVFFSPIERDALRVDIHDGLFKQNGSPISTKEAISHGKKGFAAFTLDINGELSLFNHIDHNKTGIAHSSMNEGKPVVCAGELLIENGKLKSITTHSGHYRPSLYNIYKTLEYFKNHGVDISETKVYSFKDPSVGLGIASTPSKYKPFFESNAQDLFDSSKAGVRKILLNMKKDMDSYQYKKHRFSNRIFENSKLSSEKIKIVSSLIEYISSQEKSLNTASSISEYNLLLNEILSKIQTAEDGNSQICTLFNYKKGTLGKKLENFKKMLSAGADHLSQCKPDAEADNKTKIIEKMKRTGRKQK